MIPLFLEHALEPQIATKIRMNAASGLRLNLLVMRQSTLGDCTVLQKQTKENIVQLGMK